MRLNLGFLAIVFLAAVFTIALTFATVEVPRLINHLLSAYFPDLGFEHELIGEFMNHVRPIGYFCLAVVIALIALGFTTQRRSLSCFGSISLFLPTFGYFAFHMFFLAGVGILRVLWIPLWDLSPNLLKLGDIVYIPYFLLYLCFSLIGIDVRVPLAFFFTGSGILVFLLGVATWLYGKFKGVEIVDFWIYKYSRHPQYLGFLIWSYGVMLLATLHPFPRGGYVPGPSLTWLLSALILICLALEEEVEITKKHGLEYLKYRQRTPFMMPIPKPVSTIVAAPIQTLLGRRLPETRRDVVATLLVYSVLLISLSLPFYLLDWPPGYGWRS